MRLPVKLNVCDTEIIESNLIEKLGYFDSENNRIVIDENQPLAGKIVTLIHEAMHLSEEMQLAQGIIKKRINHDFITNAAFAIAMVLAGTDCLSDVTDDELLALNPDETK